MIHQCLDSLVEKNQLVCMLKTICQEVGISQTYSLRTYGTTTSVVSATAQRPQVFKGIYTHLKRGVKVVRTYIT